MSINGLRRCLQRSRIAVIALLIGIFVNILRVNCVVRTEINYIFDIDADIMQT